jgi:hypothetical protein
MAMPLSSPVVHAAPRIRRGPEQRYVAKRDDLRLAQARRVGAQLGHLAPRQPGDALDRPAIAV